MKKIITFLMAAIVTVFAAVSIVGCGGRAGNSGSSSNNNNTSNDNSDKTEEVVSLSMSESRIEIEEGEQYTLSVSVIPYTTSIKWTSANESIAVVNSRGCVTGVSVGNTSITVSTTDGKTKDTCIVRVIQKEQEKPPVQQETIILSKTEATLNVGDTYLLNALVTPSGSAITWTSTNEAVVTVENGLLTGKTAGTAFIRATTAGGVSAVCTVEVKEVLGLISGTITCRNRKTNVDDVDVTTKIYLVSYEAESVSLNDIMMSFNYNKPEKGIYQVSVDTAGAYKIENIKLGKYRMIITCKGSAYSLSAGSLPSGNQRKAVLGEIYNKGSQQHQEWVSSSGFATYDAQMSGFDVNVGKTPLNITRNVYGVYTGTNVN